MYNKSVKLKANDIASLRKTNAVHGSDSDDNAKIEANFHFSSEERFSTLIW